jgi:hypothetical protein
MTGPRINSTHGSDNTRLLTASTFQVTNPTPGSERSPPCLVELDAELEAQLVELILRVRLAQRFEQLIAVQVHGRLSK